MPGEDHERRISVNEANIENFARSMTKLELLMGQLQMGQGEIKTGLALVAQNQESMKETTTRYQAVCEKERHDHELRITETEGFQNRQVRNVIAAGSIGAFLTLGGAKLLTKVAAWFS